MPANQRRYAQAVPLAYICIGLAILICAGTFGIKILMLKQQLKQGAEHLGNLLLGAGLRELGANVEARRGKP